MKKISVFVALTVLIIVAACGLASAEDGCVKLAIKGTSVNLRPAPQAGGAK